MTVMKQECIRSFLIQIHPASHERYKHKRKVTIRDDFHIFSLPNDVGAACEKWNKKKTFSSHFVLITFISF